MKVHQKIVVIEFFHADRQDNSDKMCHRFIHFHGGMKALTIPPLSKTRGGDISPQSPPGLTPMLWSYWKVFASIFCICEPLQFTIFPNFIGFKWPFFKIFWPENDQQNHNYVWKSAVTKGVRRNFSRGGRKSRIRKSTVIRGLFSRSPEGRGHGSMCPPLCVPGACPTKAPVGTGCIQRLNQKPIN